MSNRMVVTGAVGLLVLVAACDVEQKPELVPEMVVAQAPPEPVEIASSSLVVPPAMTTPVNVSYEDAESVFRKGRYGEAVELFGSYVIDHPDSRNAHYMLGLSAWKTGNHGRATEALKRAVELDGEHVKARINLGRVLLEQGNARDALPHLEKAVELTDSHEAWRVLGNAKAQLGMSEEAIEAYQQALVVNERDYWSMNNYGLLLIQLGRFDEALLPLARAVELNPTSPVFQNNLGVALERSGMLGGARDAFIAAVDADSTFVKAKLSLERVQARLGGEGGETPDLSAIARTFVEEVRRWSTGR